jgi:hypothetical protein
MGNVSELVMVKEKKRKWRHSSFLLFAQLQNQNENKKRDKRQTANAQGFRTFRMARLH